ncbi:methylmalonic aciduria and homocystinuria type D protein [Microcoleus sp. FACHB-1515]|uniref:methylmalonic aciduria and homocystinuria type D protein n=1 Tax=Cyanophyceae TaxID=3028117 RepID=UPI0016824927|nr:methylmalonic aciduria and homocystinuria type D protein [Microcoleus sp. FACHB-1515]MBD2092804.1 methylmalonic aciduria and homocystinuria type D protein [Microcoleus sp. FACHB-1515]
MLFSKVDRLDRIVNRGENMQCTVHTPNAYLCTHQAALLPDWQQPVASVLVVLQPCPISLFDRTTETEVYKDLLRQQFLQFGESIVRLLQRQSHHATRFDPRTGLPIDATAGTLRLHDVAVVRSLLGYDTLDCGGCLTIVHPQWQGAVYPATLLSSAPPVTVERAMQQVENVVLASGR